jgi:hypothetical protein
MSFQVFHESALAGQSTGDAVGLEMRTSALRARLNTVVDHPGGQSRALSELAEEGRLLSDVRLSLDQTVRKGGSSF